MNNTDEEFEKDPRIACQFGTSCYRKNKDHLEKYKHKPRASPKTNEKKEKRLIDEAPISLKQQKLNFFFTKNSCSSKDFEEKNNERPPARNDFGKEGSSSESIDDKKLDIRVNKIDNPTTSKRFRSGEKNSITTSSSNNVNNSEISRDECDRIIKELFLVKMPDDFYSLWEFCKHISPTNPKDALADIDLTLVGPYDVLNNELNESVDKSAVLRHWRYFYDPPEFQTVIKKNNDSDGFHIGYYRDQPEELPAFVSSNNANKDSLLTQIGENIFAALDWYLKQSEKSSNPFKKIKLNNVKTELHNWAIKHNFSLEKTSRSIRARDSKVVCRTFHNAGIVVPYDKKTELGYRPLSETPSNLRKLLNQIQESKTDEERLVHFSKLHEIVTWANIAMDEGDHGTCLELGIDLFCFGSPLLHKMIIQLLLPAYELLGRQPFATILKAHLQDRRRVDKLSILSNNT